MTSSAGSTPPSAERGPRAQGRARHPRRVGQVGDGRRAARGGRDGRRASSSSSPRTRRRGTGSPPHGDPANAELVVVLGGDGTMLRALRTFLGTGIPVLGVNFGRVGFLSSLEPEELEDGLARAFAGELDVVELPTLEVVNGGEPHVAVNDVVVTSGEIGRMVELEWAVGGEDLGRVPCDGLICSTPSGSTAYNLSNGGPVLMWGIEAMATTFVAPHSLHARPLVVPPGKDVVVWNRTPDVPVVVLVDGHRVGEAGPGRPRHGAARRGAHAARARSPRRRSSAGIARASRPSPAADRCGGRGARLRSPRAASTADREPRPHPRGRARARARPRRAHRRDRRGEDDRHPGDRPAARREGRRRRGRRRRGARRTSRRSSTSRTGSSTRRGSRRSATSARTTSPVSSSRAA